MDVESFVFDADGDLLLVLAYPPHDLSSHLTQLADSIPNSRRRSYSSSSSSGSSSVLTPETNFEAKPILGYTTENAEKTQSIRYAHMLVSSKAMMLASAVFRGMLQVNSFERGDTSRFRDKVKIPLPNDDPTAFIIILDLIHFHFGRVPKQVSLNVLTKLSVLVDKYAFQQVTSLCIGTWMTNLSEEEPSVIGDELRQWLSIAWVFQLDDVFQSVTRVLELKSTRKMSFGKRIELPIPERVFEAIEEHRTEGIAEVIDLVENLRTRYGQLSSLIACEAPGGISKREKSACDAMMLGSIERSANKAGIYPAPSWPYHGLSLEHIFREAAKIRMSALCDFTQLLDTPKAHGRNIELKNNVDELQVRHVGLTFADVFLGDIDIEYNDKTELLHERE